MATQKVELTAIAVQGHKRQRPARSRWKIKIPLLGLILPALLLVFWWIGTATGALDAYFFSSPAAVLRTLGHLLSSGVLIREFWSTLERIIIGASLGIMGGILLGGFTGYIQQVERILDPSIQALRAVPAVAWIPFLILALGIDSAPKVALIAIATFFIAYVNMYAGVRGTDQKLIELAHAYRLPRWRVLRQIILPSALPQIFVALRLSAAMSWIAAVFSEILIGNSGLGVLLNDGRSLSRPDQTIVLMIVLGLAGKCSDGLIQIIERWATGWKTTFNGV